MGSSPASKCGLAYNDSVAAAAERPERKDKDNSGRCCSLEAAAGPNKEDPDPGGKAWVVE